MSTKKKKAAQPAKAESLAPNSTGQRPVTTPTPIPTRTLPQSGTPPQAERRKVAFGNIGKSAGHKVVLYGPGGIGKTTFAAASDAPVAFIDLEESLPVLLGNLEKHGLRDNIMPVSGVTGWQGLRDTLNSAGWDDIKTIVIDSATKAEEMALLWMYDNIKNNGQKVSRLEDYGYKSGYRHLYDTFSLLLADLDVHARAGRNIVLICHDVSASVPNPLGQDWIRYEPRLTQHKDFCPLRFRVKEWADHVLAILYDVEVAKGKGKGSGTRTLYPAELPHCMAKSRTIQDIIPIEDVTMLSSVWGQIITK